MKLLEAKSYRCLLLKCILLTYFLNLLLTPIARALSIFPSIGYTSFGYYLYLFTGFVILLLSVLWGRYIRKCNQPLLLAGGAKRKRYSTLIAVAGLILLVCLLKLDLIGGLYMFLSGILLDNVDRTHTLLYAFFDQSLSFFTLFSVWFCSTAVFFEKPVKKKLARASETIR